MVLNKLLTLVLIRQQQKILLGMKKKGFGQGRWNGFGGKVEPGETILAAAQRELEEEACITCDSLQKVGLLKFEFAGDPQILEVHVFTSNMFQGEPTETEEMCPKWFKETEIPFEEMWPDDKYWFPYLLGGNKFSGYFLFEGHDTILKQTLNEVDDFEADSK